MDSAGDYLLIYGDVMQGTVTRANPKMSVQVNGVPVDGALTATHYVRNASGHIRSSGSLVTLLSGLSANDYVTVTAEQEAASGHVVSLQLANTFSVS